MLCCLSIHLTGHLYCIWPVNLEVWANSSRTIWSSPFEESTLLAQQQTTRKQQKLEKCWKQAAACRRSPLNPLLYQKTWAKYSQLLWRPGSLWAQTIGLCLSLCVQDQPPCPTGPGSHPGLQSLAQTGPAQSGQQENRNPGPHSQTPSSQNNQPQIWTEKSCAALDSKKMWVNTH